MKGVSLELKLCFLILNGLIRRNVTLKFGTEEHKECCGYFCQVIKRTELNLFSCMNCKTCILYILVKSTQRNRDNRESIDILRAK